MKLSAIILLFGLPLSCLAGNSTLQVSDITGQIIAPVIATNQGFALSNGLVTANNPLFTGGTETNNTLLAPSIQGFIFNATTNWTNTLPRQAFATIVIQGVGGGTFNETILVSNSPTDVTTNSCNAFTSPGQTTFYAFCQSNTVLVLSGSAGAATKASSLQYH